MIQHYNVLFTLFAIIHYQKEKRECVKFISNLDISLIAWVETTRNIMAMSLSSLKDLPANREEEEMGKKC
jgi:hypothetical protein